MSVKEHIKSFKICLFESFYLMPLINIFDPENYHSIFSITRILFQFDINFDGCKEVILFYR